MGTKSDKWAWARFASMRGAILIPVLIALLVGGVALSVIRHSHAQAAVAQQEQVGFANLQATANLESSLEWEAIAHSNASSSVIEELNAARSVIRTKLAELARRDPNDLAETAVIPGAFARYHANLTRELSLLRSGRVKSARQFDSNNVDPAFSDLRELLVAATQVHSQEADAATARESTATALAGAGGFALIILLAWVWYSAVRRSDKAVRRSERRYRALAQNATDLVTVIDDKATITYQSDSASRVLGYRPDELVGRELAGLMHPDDLTRIEFLLVTDHPEDGSGSRFECRLHHRDGTWVDVETAVSALPDGVMGTGRLVLTSRGIGERKTLERQLRHQAFHDELTGLASRALFEERVEHALVRARRTGDEVAVLFLDVDDFKLVNDSLGHGAGDALLQTVAERLDGALRGGDTAARLGGDEFGVLTVAASGADGAAVVAERVLNVIGKPYAIADSQISPRASIGVAIAEPKVQTPVELLRNADLAMYSAKARDRGGFAMFEPAMREGVRRRFELNDQLETALAEDQFELRYQPIVVLESEQIAGVEALIRWNHPDHGMVSPLEFIPLAERNGLIVPIGRWVLNEACRQAGAWQQEGLTGDDFYVCVNVSTKQLTDPHLVEDVRAALQEGGLRPDQLVLEVTENLLVRNFDETRKRLEELKQVGVRLAVDDFGTGYSALSYLQRFPIDMLKIDRSFVAGLGQADGSTIVRAIIELGLGLDLDIVAEGIEEEEELDELRALHSNLGQGFYFARPLDPGAMAEMLRTPEPQKAPAIA
ncbi:MAG: hypothetical protein QOD14_497 [Solirubrobacterales bacterium]|nr:hypothetical protein [Solirubrobacterales bacterium]